MNLQTEILIIGAGISGLAAATELKRAGKKILIVDKARGVGGRLANRRFDGALFDHGAQFMTARESRFKALMTDWQEKGIIEEWYRGNLDGSGNQRFRGSPAMSAVAKELAQNLDTRLQIPVTSIQQDDQEWLISQGKGNSIRAKAILMTPPVPQSLAILNKGNVVIPETTKNRLERIQYEKCFAVMALLDGPSLIPKPGFLRPESGPIAWAADNQTKGVSERPAITIHATGEYSEANWDCDRNEVAQEIIKNAQAWLGATVVEYQIHGWRYSKPVVTDTERCAVIHQQPPLIIAGDAFGGPRVEGAVLSGWAAAKHLLQLSPNEQTKR